MTTTVVSDSFNRANSTTTLGNADTGQTWQYSTSSSWGISNNQAYPVKSGTVAYVNSGYSDYTAQVDLTWNTNDDCALVLRYNPSDGSLVEVGYSSSGMWIWTNDPVNGWNEIATYATTLGTGVTRTIKVVASGFSLTVYENGAQVMATTTTVNQTIANVGLRAGSGTDERFDNFSVTTSGGGTTNAITLSDNVTTSDTIAKTVKRNLALADSITTSDTVALVRNLHVAISDSVVSSDTITKSVSRAITFSDSVTSFDSLTTAQAHAYSLSFADSVTTSDAETKSASESLHDAITATDVMAQVRTYFRTYADSIATSDNLTKQMAHALAFSDGVTVTDTVTAQKVTVYSIHMSDSVSVTDAITSLNRILSVALSDSIGTSDAITMSGGKILNPIRGSIQLLASLDNKVTLLASLDNQVSLVASLDNKISLQAGVGPVDGQNFSIKQFSSDVLTFTYSGDLSGCTLEWIMQYNVNSASPLIKKTSANGISIVSTSSAQSVFTVSVTNADMNPTGGTPIGQGTYYHQASLVDALGESNPISTGNVVVTASSSN